MRESWQTAWASRYFLLALVRNDLHTRYRRSLLGIGWSLLFPLTTTLVTCLVFQEVFHVEGQVYAPYILCGLACWSFLTGSALQGCESYTRAESYIRQHPLPVSIYPLRTVLVGFTHFLIALGVVVVLTWGLRGSANLGGVLHVMPGLAILFAFGWSLATLMSFCHLVFRDTQHILEVGFQVLFYLTPIIYPVRVLRDSRVGWWADWNPLLAFLDLVRSPLLEGRAPTLTSLSVAGGLTLAGCLLALGSLRFQQRRVVFYL